MRLLPVVSNTTPLITLAGVGLLDLLNQLYNSVIIPDVVSEEYTAKASSNEPRLEALAWLQTHPVVIDASFAQIPGLGRGEAAALTLALQMQVPTILLDERRARRIAQQQGLHVTGTLGVLIAAKQVRLIAGVRQPIDTMIAQGRYISPTLYAQVLSLAGEDQT